MAFRAALCDSFNTPAALDVLRDLVSRTNVYINSRGTDLNVDLLEYIAKWVSQMLRMFGLGEENSEIGWGQGENQEGNINVSQSVIAACATEHLPCLFQREEVLMPYLRTLSAFRDAVRRTAMNKGEGALQNILALCDKLRDVDLVPLGVALDDQDGK